MKSDFKKKKVKVGRKVKRANITEIKVKSKQIVIQSQYSDNTVTNIIDNNTINIIKKQLHHNSETMRLSALNKIKSLLTSINKEQSDDSFISLLFPEIIEMLFHEDKDTRSLVKEIAAYALELFRYESFQYVMPVIVTYICSGLTHLHKVTSQCTIVKTCNMLFSLQGIRKDFMLLLKALTQSHGDFLTPYLTKVLNLLFYYNIVVTSVIY